MDVSGVLLMSGGPSVTGAALFRRRSPENDRSFTREEHNTVTSPLHPKKKTTTENMSNSHMSITE